MVLVTAVVLGSLEHSSEGDGVSSLLPLKKSLLDLLFHVCERFDYMYGSVSRVPGALGGSRRTSDPLKLELINNCEPPCR